jgi:hypothetical protein
MFGVGTRHEEHRHVDGCELLHRADGLYAGREEQHAGGDTRSIESEHHLDGALADGLR